MALVISVQFTGGSSSLLCVGYDCDESEIQRYRSGSHP